jgi:hypothetical protein
MPCIAPSGIMIIITIPGSVAKNVAKIVQIAAKNTVSGALERALSLFISDFRNGF